MNILQEILFSIVNRKKYIDVFTRLELMKERRNVKVKQV